MLTRIRNAALARHDRAEMPALARSRSTSPSVLKAEGYVDDVRVERGRGAARRSPSCSATGATGRARSTASAASRARAAASTSATTASRACCSGMGISILSTSPRRDDRPRGAQAARRRRAPLRGVVMAMTHATSKPRQTQDSRASASARSTLPKGVTRRRSRTARSRSRARRARSRASSRRTSTSRSRAAQRPRHADASGPRRRAPPGPRARAHRRHGRGRRRGLHEDARSSSAPATAPS